MRSANLYAILTCKDGGFAHIGEATASKLLADYGGAYTVDEFFAHMESDNMDAFRQVKGVGDKAILGLQRGYMVLTEKIKLARYLDELGLPDGILNKLFDHWGKRAISKIKHNPYQLLFVLPWEKVDPIGLRLGPEYHPCRLVGAVENCMYVDFEQGQNTCITQDLLCKAMMEFLNCDMKTANDAVAHALKVGAVLEHKGVLQIPAAYSFERQTEHLLSNNREYNIGRQRIENFLQNGNYSSLTEEQVNVVVNALQNHISVFYGRGGRGKTFTVSAVCDAVSSADVMGRCKTLEPVLCAVAAKASQRMRKESGRGAHTIARILHRWKRRDLENKIVIVDEASMVSLSDAYNLFKKIPDSSRLVLLGDPGQIPSIGAGRVFYDVIKSGKVVKQELTINQRQDEKTDKQLESILSGHFPEFPDYRPGDKTGLYRAVVKNVHEVERKAMELYGMLKGQAQIISPLKQYAGGSDSINYLIHEEYHDRSGYCPGTPVVYTKNKKQMDIKADGRPVSLTNGSMGIVKEVLNSNPRSNEPYLKVAFDYEGEVLLTWEETSEKYLDKSYCLTCHKAQGSDWDTVIIVLPCNDNLVDRNMIYTALSRCKVRAILVYYDHDYVRDSIGAPAAYERRRSSLFGG